MGLVEFLRQWQGSRLAGGVALSGALHALVAALLLWGPTPFPELSVKRGEPLFVELPPGPDSPPPGRPGRPEPAAPPAPRTPPAPKVAPTPPAPPAPRIASAPKAPPAPVLPPAPRVTSTPPVPRVAPPPPPKVAPEPPEPPKPVVTARPEPPPEPRAPEPPAPSEAAPPAAKAPDADRPPSPVARPPAVAEPAPEPTPAPRDSSPPPPARAEGAPPSGPAAPAPRVASVPPPGPARRPVPDIRSLGPGGTGGAGGTGEGRAGIEGEPIPLDSTDPRYSDYLDQVRRRIKDKWGYPCVKNDDTRECEYKTAQLIVEFGIAKNGRVPFIHVVRSSGYPIYDDYAVNAVKLADFPPIPDSFSKTGVPILATFSYVVQSSLTNILR